MQTPLNTVERSTKEVHAGQYWRAVEAINEEDIDKGMVLLLLSIRWVDNHPHTIILHPHPSMAERISEHRFLFDDFLHKFRIEPDYQRIRDAEIAAIYKRISNIQGQIQEIDKNPAAAALFLPGQNGHKEKPDDRVTHPVLTLPDAADNGETPQLVTHSKEAENQATHELVTPNDIAAIISSDTLNGITARRVNEMRAVAEQKRDLADRKAKFIQDRTEAISEAVNSLVPYFKERATAALATTEDVREYAEKLLSGVESLDLYCLKKVKVKTICKGKSAPSTEPLTIMQRKLYACEEIAVYTDFDDGEFDFDNANEFFDALGKYPKLRDQIFAAPRSVVCMAWRRDGKDYGDERLNDVLNESNRSVWLLVRDGENIYRIESPVESHMASNRLFPSKDEVDKLFTGMDGSTITYNSIQYTDSLNDHEKLAVHYKQFLLLLAGLNDRKKLFGDFYDKSTYTSFLPIAFQQKYFRFIYDDDAEFMLPEEKRESINEWTKRMNSHLQSGSRVICYWKEAMSHESAPGVVKYNWRATMYSEKEYFKYEPKNAFDIVVAFRKDADLYVEAPVAGETDWRPGQSSHLREFNAKVKLTGLQRLYYNNEIRYLCLDTVKAEDISFYIHSRYHRRHYEHYIKFFKAAYAHLKEVARYEADTRAKLLKAIDESNIATGDQAKELVDGAIRAWRAINRGAMVPKDDPTQFAQAWKTLLNQVYVLAGHGRDRVATVEKMMTSEKRAPLRLVITGRNKLVLYAAPLDSERDDRCFEHVWVQKIMLGERKSKISVVSRKWAALVKNSAKENIIFEWPGLEKWIMAKTPPITLEQKNKALDLAHKSTTRLTVFNKPLSDEQFDTILADLKRATEEAIGGCGYVRFPNFIIPLGLVIRNNKAGSLCYIEEGYAVLYRHASKEQRKKIASWFVGMFKHSAAGQDRLNGVDFQSAGNFAFVDLKIAERRMFTKGGFYFMRNDMEASRNAGFHGKLRGVLACIDKERNKDRDSKTTPWNNTYWLANKAFIEKNGGKNG